MDIKIPLSWLKQYVQTNASPADIAKALSLCSASVERSEKVGDDIVYDIEITTNRVDMLSVYGLARETNAVLPEFGFKSSLKDFPEGVKCEVTKKEEAVLRVKIENPLLCPRFTAVLLKNVQMGKSPKLMIDNLEKSGIRSINNVVDISNYCMLETGHPMHTFDYDKIKDHTMILRESKKGETITTLDGIKRILSKGSIVIEDGSGKLIDLCGIMGGENSSVTENTKNVLLFVQVYDPVKIRRTCQELSFRTDAAIRFEKGIDSEGVLRSLERGVKLFIDNTGCTVNGKVLDIYPKPLPIKSVSIRKSRIDQILGVDIQENKIKSILESLNFKVKSISNGFIIEIPSFRTKDITIEEDIIEEIARIYGYHNIPSILPEGQIPNIPQDRELYWEQRIKETLKYWGFTETYSYSLVSEKLSKIGVQEQMHALTLLNPLTEDNQILRTNLLSSILEVIAKNNTQYPSSKIFELSMIYKQIKKGELPKEVPHLVIAINGGNYSDIKGVIEQVFNEIGRNDFKISSCNNPLLIKEKSANIKDIGDFGEINDDVKQIFGLTKQVAVSEMNCEKLFSKATQNKHFVPPSIYPSIKEDLTFIRGSKQVYIADVIESIYSINNFIKRVGIKTIYKETVTFEIEYQSKDKTLTSTDIESIRKNIVLKLKEKYLFSLKGSV